jgi:SAM-dependent methyltransferase
MILTFELTGKHFCYQESEYNGTSRNERAVEVPVGLFLLGQATDGEASVLELGAVLPHYRAGWPITSPAASPHGAAGGGNDGHTVIDLHEVYPGVTNADVLTWEPPQQYDLIISISTLDHLHDLEELIDALRRLRRWLAPGGLLFITLPYGQPASVGGGEWIDSFVLGENDATAVWRMDKVDPIRHLWEQVDDLAKPPLAYNGQSPAANTVYLLFWGDLAGWWRT